MRDRWSLGVVVAIVVAICAATSGAAQSTLAQRVGPPVQVTLTLQPDGASLRITHDAFAVTLKL